MLYQTCHFFCNNVHLFKSGLLYGTFSDDDNILYEFPNLSFSLAFVIETCRLQQSLIYLVTKEAEAL